MIHRPEATESDTVRMSFNFFACLDLPEGQGANERKERMVMRSLAKNVDLAVVDFVRAMTFSQRLEPGCSLQTFTRS